MGLRPSMPTPKRLVHRHRFTRCINQLPAKEIWPCPWTGLEAVEFATLDWVDWFNNRRILEPIGNRPPTEAEAAYYRQTEHTALAA